MKIVKVRIAVAVDPDGEWDSSGAAGSNARDDLLRAAKFLGRGQRVYWLTAELPVPEAQEIAATVEEAPRA